MYISISMSLIDWKYVNDRRSDIDRTHLVYKESCLSIILFHTV